MIPTNNENDDNQIKEIDWFMVKLILISVSLGFIAGTLIILLN